jgi:hypothetical protein
MSLTCLLYAAKYRLLLAYYNIRMSMYNKLLLNFLPESENMHDFMIMYNTMKRNNSFYKISAMEEEYQCLLPYVLTNSQFTIFSRREA